MRNNVRRNRNIGTAKQGYGLKNTMKIAQPLYRDDIRCYFERLEHYTKQKRTINGHEFEFVIETLNKDSFHACSIDDVARMIEHIPPEDYGEMKYIIFRQPKRKEKIISPVWGRLIYAYEFEDECYPAIIIEAANRNETLKWSKKLSVNNSLEFARLKADGHQFEECKRFFQADMSPKFVRNTQLYRTLPHEFGHYVHYLDVVEKPAIEDEEWEAWEQRWNYYHDSIPSAEKEKFAHSYADKLKAYLLDQKIIPFNPIDENFE